MRARETTKPVNICSWLMIAIRVLYDDLRAGAAVSDVFA